MKIYAYISQTFLLVEVFAPVFFEAFSAFLAFLSAWISSFDFPEAWESDALFSSMIMYFLQKN